MTTASTKKREYRYVGNHVDDLADGRVLEPGGFYKLSQDELDEPHNKARIDSGLLLDTEAKEGDS